MLAAVQGKKKVLKNELLLDKNLMNQDNSPPGM
jgi:hypothetical protein